MIDPYYLLGQALSYFTTKGIKREERTIAGWRIRVDKIETPEHREMVEEDLT